MKDGAVVLADAAKPRLQGIPALKKDHPRLQVTMSVGGWGAGGFSENGGGKNGYERHWDAAAQASFLWNQATRHFIRYEDAQSLKAKTAFVRSNRLGGIMYREQDEDPKGELLDVLWYGLHEAPAKR